MNKKQKDNRTAQKTTTDKILAGIQKTQEPEVEFALGRSNYYLLIIGFAIIVIGFALMVGGASNDPTVFNEEEIFSFRRITLAPIVVVFGFVFEIWAIMKKPADNE